MIKNDDPVEIVNFMSHDLNIVNSKREVIFCQRPSNFVARVDLTSTRESSIIVGKSPNYVEIPVVRVKPANIKVQDRQGNKFPFPEPAAGRVYVVSTLVAGIIRRPDILSPDTTSAGAVRDGDGELFAVKQLQVFK